MMSVLEICQLRIKDGISAEDPSVPKSLIEVRSRLKSRIANTNSRFYQCIDDPTLVYVFGVWPSIASHHDFLSSPAKSEILSPQQDLLDLGWILHMPLPSMESLPLDAQVMSLARFFIKSGEDHVVLEAVLKESLAKTVDVTKPYKVAKGWRCDVEQGKQEALVISGWAGGKAHEDPTCASILPDSYYENLKLLSSGFEVKQMSNMEDIS